MSEADNNSQGEKPKTSKLAIWSLLLGLVGFGLWYLPVGMTGLAGIVLGIVALRKIQRSAGSLQGRGFAIAGIVTSVIYIVVLVCAVTPWVVEQKRHKQVVACGQQLSQLGKAMALHAETNGDKYPVAETWCDLLLKQGGVTNEQLKCPGDAKGPCSYTLNRSIVGIERSQIPEDVVVLFESGPDWSQFGGPEILTTENHKGKGCNILFNDGHVEFVPSNELSQLKWKAEAETP
ncbi:MAG: DUF4190 domain-containing protein [Planctomycetota bacterium]|jgi:prepilin-type processing-associated H-X9-DG protein